MKKSIIILGLSIISQTINAQYRPEVGVELAAASLSSLGGTVGGALRFGLGENYGEHNEGVAFGAIIRYQHLWNTNNFTGMGTSGSMYGAGAYYHYRFMEWFFIGAEMEYIRNPFVFPQNQGQKIRRWTLAAFLGAGASKDFDWVRINLGVQYDIADALRDPQLLRPSPFRNQYFIRLSNPAQPGAGGQYLPIIYRLTFFFPIG
jgi:hypothetical protein